MNPSEATANGTFLEYYLGVFTSPRKTFARLRADPRRLAFGAVALLISALLYTLAILLLALGGGLPVIPPLLNISHEDYYFIQVLLMVPVLLAGWLLASGVVQILSKPLGGSGTFEGTAALLGFSIVPPTFVTLVPDGISGILSLLGAIGRDPMLWTTQGFGQVVSSAYLALYVLWFLVLFPLAVSAVQGLALRRAILAGAAGYFVYQAMLLIFLR